MAISLSDLYCGLISLIFIVLHLAAAPHPPDTGCSDKNGENRCVDSIDDDDPSCAPPQQIIPIAGEPNNGNEQKWKWDPTSKYYPCNIRRISHSELLRLYGKEGLPNLYPYPLVIYPDADGDNKNDKTNFANLTTVDNLPSSFPPDFRVTLTGSDSLSTHRRTIPLTQYLHEVLVANNGSGETLPDQLGNETWYLFGETFSDEWSTFLQNYALPPCRACTPMHREQSMIALSFGIGNIGSGVQWHLHGPGFSETIHGRKHWVLYPHEQRPDYDLNFASRHWMENTYPDLEDWNDDDLQDENKSHETFLKRRNGRFSSTESRSDLEKRSEEAHDVERDPSSKKPWECTISEGEMIYFPDQWHHATINLEKYTVFVSSFTTEHEG
mmetsp:Transcript_36195/g.87365  ORF Transcript_36195/g.87365 Transcript_36195/m.87365 type:complete len:383 (+) Transcript_36195:60-1208(+)